MATMGSKGTLETCPRSTKRHTYASSWKSSSTPSWGSLTTWVSTSTWGSTTSFQRSASPSWWSSTPMRRATTTSHRYPTPRITKFRWWILCGQLELRHWVSSRKSISGSIYWGSYHMHLDTLNFFNYINLGMHHIQKKLCHWSKCVRESKWKVSWVIRIKNHWPRVRNIVDAYIGQSIVSKVCW